MKPEEIIAKNFTLVDGGITAYGSDGEIVGVSHEVPEDGLLSFRIPIYGVVPDPAKVYCELVSTSPHGQEFPYRLLVNGGESHLSLCQRSNSDQFVVIYGAFESSSTTVYKWETCADVYIYVIGQQF